jgi:hypothetical protein
VFTVALAVTLVVGWALTGARARRRGLVAETWACGFAAPTPRMAYTASSFAAPLLGAFRAVAGVRTERGARRFATHATDPVLDRIVRPAWHGVRAAATRVRAGRRGSLSLYLVYVGAAVLVVLLYLVAAGGAP